jgi:type IV secretory pathway TrbL component
MKSFLPLAVVAATLALTGCNSTSGSAPAAGTQTAAAASQRVKLSRAEILSTYPGKTLRSSDHTITFNSDGSTWRNSTGQSGTYTVTDDGVISLQGGLNLRLAVYKDGNRYYHRNVVSSQGGYYSI